MYVRLGADFSGRRVGGPTAEWDSPWSEAVELGAGWFPVIAVGPNSTTVVWNSGAGGGNGPIHLRNREAGKPWLPAHQIGFGAEHTVASNSSNVTVVAWAQPSPQGSRVMVTRRESSGSWSEPQEVRRLPPERTVPGFGLHVAVGETGAAAVWWEEMIEAEDPPDWNWSYASYAAPSGPWERAHLLVDRQHAVPGTAASIDSMGRLDVVYAARTGIWMDRRDATHGWVGHEQVAPERDGSPILMETPTGDTVVVAWPTDDGIAARRRNDGQWESVTRWKAPTADWTCEADMDDTGNVTFAWFSPNYRIQVREWPRGDDLEPVRPLLEGGLDAYGAPCSWSPVLPATSCSVSSTGAAARQGACTPRTSRATAPWDPFRRWVDR